MLKKSKNSPPHAIIKEAFYFAAEKHDGQYRKGGHVPYFAHPALVALKVAQYLSDDSVIAAAVLHDVIEECNVNLTELKKRFGRKVSRIVDEVTVKVLGDKDSNTWKKKKQEYLIKIKGISRNSLFVIAADKIINMEAYFNFISIHPNNLKRASKLFGGSPTDYLWYYGEVLNVIKGRLRGNPISKEYEETLKRYQNKFS